MWIWGCLATFLSLALFTAPMGTSGEVTVPLTVITKTLWGSVETGLSSLPTQTLQQTGCPSAAHPRGYVRVDLDRDPK